MSELDRSVRRPPAQPRHSAGAGSYLDREDSDSEVGFADALNWLTRHRVTVAALVMIVASLIWKAGFLGQFYFRQDDIHFTELALASPLDWKYLSYIGSGHLHPGVLLIVWIMARVAPYSWGGATAVLIVMLAVASVAAWWLLRTLIGNRPAILIPLALYLVTPLTFPNDSWWQSAIESAPLQAAIFLTLIAHIYYVRTGRARHLVAAAVWLGVGLFFFEKAIVIPVILFGVTAGFLLDGRLTATAREALVRYWRAWAVYAVMVVVYAAVLLSALSSSTVKPSAGSAGQTLTFSLDLVKDTLLPGLFGGPWSWYFTSSDAIAYSNAPSELIWLSLLGFAAIVVASVLTWSRAWRAWAMLAVWVVVADIAPVLLGRLSSLSSYVALFDKDTRYVADTAAVAAICMALAFWPVIRPQEAEPRPGGRRQRREQEYFATQTWRVVGLCLTGVLVVGSIVSVHEYEKATAPANYAGQVFWDNARAGLASDLPAGTVIRDVVMPPYLMTKEFYLGDAYESVALAPLESSAAKQNVRWMQTPTGTIDNLLIFNGQGQLTKAAIGNAVGSVAGPSCWPFRKGKAVIPLTKPASPYAGTLRLGYFTGGSAVGETVTVVYGSKTLYFTAEAAPAGQANNVYLRITGAGSPTEVTVIASVPGLCIGGDVAAGNLQAGFPAPLTG
jgi:hypothetical protein